MMKRNVFRIVSVVAIVSILCMCMPISAFAAEEYNSADEYEKIADNAVTQFTTNFTKEKNIETNSQPILEAYNRIYELVYDSDSDSFNEAYGGAYVEDDKLVLLFVGNVKDLLNVLGATVEPYDDFISFKAVEHTYNSLYKAKQSLDNIMQKRSDYRKMWGKHEDSTSFDSIVQYYIDEQNNKLNVTINPSEQWKDITVVTGASDAMLLGEENQDLIEYEYKDIVYDLYSSTEKVYPGQAIYNVLTNESGAVIDGSRSSIGLRSQYIGTDGAPYFGFLTVAHGFEFDDYMYVEHNGLLYRIGEAKWKVMNVNLGVDVAFVALDEGYEMTNTVYFSSYYSAAGTDACDSASGPSSGGDRVYANYYTYIPSGYTIYSNGSSTGRTSGTVVAFDTTVNIDGAMFYHFCTVTNPFTRGDSGGIMYSNATSGGTYDNYITVGMVEGGSVSYNVAFISTYHRLRTALNENASSMGNITFLTIY